jgi:hypothetical protein
VSGFAALRAERLCLSGAGPHVLSYASALVPINLIDIHLKRFIF